MEALDHMIENNLFSYHCDPWYTEPGATHYHSVLSKKGQINYKGETFVINHSIGHSGSGGMDEGSPNSVTITRIK